jgi:ferredoxin
MAKLSVNKAICIGCGLCTQLDGSLFALGDDGKAEAVQSDLPGDLVSGAEDVASNCPVGAISVD